MFGIKKSEKVEEVKKLTEEELIAQDNQLLTNFDNNVKKIGKFIVFSYPHENTSNVIKIEDVDANKIYIALLDEYKSEFQKTEKQKGCVYYITCNTLGASFYDYNKAQQFLTKYLELLSS